MRRRELLRIGTLATTTALAGCSQLQDGGTQSDATFAPGSKDYLAIAVGELNKAALALREIQSIDDLKNVSFDAASPRQRIQKARQAITSAEQAAGSTTPAIAAVSAYADAVAASIDAVVKLLSASRHLRDAKGKLTAANGRDITTAEQRLAAAQAASSTAVAKRTAAREALAGADADRLRRLGAEYTALSNGIETLATYVTGVDGLATGYDRMATGIGHLRTADKQVTNDTFDAAGESFQAAQASFEAATNAFKSAIPKAASVLDAKLTTGQQRSRALEQLAAGYIALLDSRTHLTRAEAKIDADAYEAARDQLKDGRAAAQTSEDRFENGQSLATDAFADKFDTALDRAAAIQSLASGYVALLDSRTHLTSAESKIKADAYEAARDQLSEGRTAAQTSEDRFENGQSLATDAFADKFATALDRAAAMESLAGGYLTLLDGRSALVTARTRIENRKFEAARDALKKGHRVAAEAEATFAMGASEGGTLFSDEFAAARARAGAIEALATGYIHLLDARQAAARGRAAFLAENDDTASAAFTTGIEQSTRAERTFRNGEPTDSTLFAAEFEQAYGHAAAMQALTTGYRTVVRQRAHLQTGRTQLEQREFSAAAETFASVETELQSTQQTFQEGQTQAGNLFAGAFQRALCQIGHLLDAVAHFEAAAEAGMNRNRDTYRTELEQGKAALDRVDEC